MGRLTKHRRQDAVYWEKVEDVQFNRPLLASPVGLRVRWEEKQLESLDSQNNVIKTDIVVEADRLLVIGSIVWKGKLRNIPDPPTSGLYQVVVRDTIPNLKNTETRYVALLTRYTNTLPDLA